MPCIALIGFRPFERNALGSYLRLMARREPCYTPVEEAENADWLVVDGDQAGFVDQVLRGGRLARSVFVGSKAPEGAAAWLQRPIDPQHLLRELDVLVALDGQPVAVPTVPAALESAVMGGTAPPPAPPLVLASQPRPWAGGEARPAAPPTELVENDPPGAFHLPPLPVGLPSIALQAPVPVQAAPQVLLLDPSETMLRFLEKQVADAGLAARRARDAHEALALLARHEFSLLVMETELGDAGEHDGFTLCQYIKRNHVHLGETAPPVVLMSARSNAVQRVRAQLAGCDEFLAKPLQDTDLRRVLHQLVAGPRAAAAV